MRERPIIRIGKKGRIIAGQKAGKYVFIEDDVENTGGFLIFTAPDLEFEVGPVYDSWVENMTSLESWFEESGWVIEWLED